MISSVHLDPALPDCYLPRETIAILQRAVTERTGRPIPMGEAGPCPLVLGFDPAIGAEGFRIADEGDGLGVRGGDERGLLYGVGKLLRDGRYDSAGFTPGAWRGMSVPRRSVRGMYFATHFHNFFHDAPIEAVCRYVEELALWGCNALTVWFDMHHFNGIDDPAAVAMIARLRRILQAANAVGMGAALGLLANEDYADSPEHLRADWTAGHDGYFAPPEGHYHREICPSKPGGLKRILDVRRDMLAAFADLDMQYLWLWPYDQGGCTCARCAPWGVNGFLRTAEPVAKLAKEFWPSARIILSTWYFDHFIHGEWEGLDRAFAGGAPAWVDYLLADSWGSFPEYPLRHGSPGGLPMLGFPEISMEHMFPWGCYGATPRPLHWQEYADATRDVLAGAFPYSEGIYEDINKAIQLQLQWDPARPVQDIVREYAAYEYAPVAADDVVQACFLMEASMGHDLSAGVRAVLYGPDAGRATAMPEVFYTLTRVRQPERYLELLQGVESRLPQYARQSWRWRVLWIRAALDAELSASGGRPTEASERYMDELTTIYGAAGAGSTVAPIGRRYLARRCRPGTPIS